jgi:hypothetical protein
LTAGEAFEDRRPAGQPLRSFAVPVAGGEFLTGTRRRVSFQRRDHGVTTSREANASVNIIAEIMLTVKHRSTRLEW